jgi:hypothetical protein
MLFHQPLYERTSVSFALIYNTVFALWKDIVPPNFKARSRNDVDLAVRIAHTQARFQNSKIRSMRPKCFSRKILCSSSFGCLKHCDDSQSIQGEISTNGKEVVLNSGPSAETRIFASSGFPPPLVFAQLMIAHLKEILNLW